MDLSGSTDQAHLTNLRIGNYGIGILFSAALSDTPDLRDLSIIGNTYGIWFQAGSLAAYARVRDSVIGDNEGPGIYTGDWGTSGQGVTISRNLLVRNARNPMYPRAAIWWTRDGAVLANNIVGDTGVCPSWDPACGAGSASHADQVYLFANQVTVAENQFSFTNPDDAGVCLHVAAGALNRIHGNTFQRCAVDIQLDAQTADNIVDQQGANIIDNGTRNVVNGVSTDHGDPDVAGVWRGTKKWAGLTIQDLDSGSCYLYLSAGKRVRLTREIFKTKPNYL